jgi:ABC-2 type transport system permease protein
MRQVWIVFAEEMKRLFRMPGTYWLLALFFLITAALYMSVFYQASVEPQRMSPLQIFWELQWLPNLIWVPLVTMRLFAPERRQGLLEATLATPTTPAAVVLGKYFAGLAVYLLGWSSVALYIAISALGWLTSADISSVFALGAVFGGAIFCIASGVLFIALGLWCSSLTKNMILSGALTVCLMLLYMLLPTMFGGTTLMHYGVLQPFSHLENLSQYVAGLASLAVVVAYAIAGAVFLFSAMLSLERRGD